VASSPATAQMTTARAGRQLPTLLPVLATVGLPTLLLTLFLLLPLVLVAVYSVYSTDPITGIMQPDFTLANYERIVSSPIYRKVFLRTLEIALLCTGIALLIAYPMAYTIGALVPRERQTLLLFLVIIPFWTSYIVRTYGWIGILQSGGFLESVLSLIPGVDAGLDVLYSRPAVIVGFVHVFLPLMILPIYASARNLDHRLIEASYDLGASPWRTFLRVTLPLTMPGVVAGATLFFIATFGAFVTPQLLGGTEDLMMGNVIADQFGEAFNWPFGAALSVVMILIVVLSLALLFRFADLESIYG